jgi:transposase
MRNVPDIHAIRVLYQREIPKRAIAKMLGISRKTVDKYTTAEYVVPVQPHMHLEKPRPSPKMDRWKPVIDAWLEEDVARPRKQRRTARKMYKDLVRLYGAEVSEVSVRRYVRQRNGARTREAFVPLEFPPGSMAEADFGHALVIVGGQEQTLPFYVMRLMASGVSFVKMYPHEKLEALLDATVSGLSFLGGVPRQLMYDNASTMVRQVLGGGKRLQTPEFKALQAHYGFEAVFANPGRGNEKGGAENLVQWAQRNLFSPVPDAASLDALNESLLQQCLLDAQTRRRPEGGPLVADLWEQEQAYLGRLPAHPFPACRHRFVRADKCLLVDWDRAHYSVPAAYAEKSLLLRVFWDHVELADSERTAAVHERQAPGGVSMQLSHYLPVLERKPRAVTHAAVIARGAPAIARYRDEFLAARPEAYREMVAILRLSETAGLDRLTAALETARAYRVYDIESVRAILAMDEQTQRAIPASLPPTDLERWPGASVRPVASSEYGWLNETGGAAE